VSEVKHDSPARLSLAEIGVVAHAVAAFALLLGSLSDNWGFASFGWVLCCVVAAIALSSPYVRESLRVIACTICVGLSATMATLLIVQTSYDPPVYCDDTCESCM
jgi:hypothetical protein